MTVNIFDYSIKVLTDVLRAVSQPARLQIMLILEGGTACVCHIEAVTGFRQAAISQQLTVLKKAGLVMSVRDGRHIFYQVSLPGILPAVHRLASELGVSSESLTVLSRNPVSGCPCPKCNPGLESRLVCKKP